MKRGVIPAVFAAIPLALLLLVLFRGADLIGGPDFIPSASETADISALRETADQIITMLASVVFGLFVLLGFSFQPGENNNPVMDVFSAAAGGLFLLFAFMSLYYGYGARMQTFEFIMDSFTNFSAVRQALGMQALFAALCAPPAFFVLTRNLLAKAHAKNVA